PFWCRGSWCGRVGQAQGLKPAFFGALVARLKPCPDTNPKSGGMAFKPYPDTNPKSDGATEVAPSQNTLSPERLKRVPGGRGRVARVHTFNVPRHFPACHQPRWGQRAQRMPRLLLRQRRGWPLRRRTFRRESNREPASRDFSNLARDWRRGGG